MSKHQILTDVSASISALKENPMAVIEQAEGFPVAILKRNTPVFYVVPATAYEMLMDKLEDIEIAEIVSERKSEPVIEVNINTL